jgi:hypothetical protein
MQLNVEVFFLLCVSFDRYFYMNCRHMHIKPSILYTFLTRYYHAVCVILVFKIIREDDPNRYGNMLEVSFVM